MINNDYTKLPSTPAVTPSFSGEIRLAHRRLEIEHITEASLPRWPLVGMIVSLFTAISLTVGLMGNLLVMGADADSDSRAMASAGELMRDREFSSIVKERTDAQVVALRFHAINILTLGFFAPIALRT